MVEVREVLGGWVEGRGLRVVASGRGWTARLPARHVEAAEAAALTRDAGFAAVDYALIGLVVEAVRPVRRPRDATGWEALEVDHDQIKAWVKGSDTEPALSLVKTETLLARQGVVVAYRTLHRYAVARCGFRSKGITLRGMVDGEPGVECRIDFAQ